MLIGQLKGRCWFSMKLRFLSRLLLCAALCMMLLPAQAELALSSGTPAQAQLQDYLTAVNALLAQQGQAQINSVFMDFPTSVVVGVTAESGAEVPEEVEMTFTLDSACVNRLELRCADAAQFLPLAAACIQAASPASDWEEVQKRVQPYVDAALADPATSFEETVNTLQGTAARMYFSYLPNQFQDSVNWLQMTLIFPQTGYAEDALSVQTPAPDADITVSEEEAEAQGLYSGYLSDDTYIHLETSPVVTPEPDSPAGEEINWR